MKSRIFSGVSMGFAMAVYGHSLNKSPEMVDANLKLFEETVPLIEFN